MKPSTTQEHRIVVPGNHDGVHLGHQALISAALEVSARRYSVAALFFDPHPSRFFFPEGPLAQITTPERRADLLRARGADEAIAQPFDAPFANLTPLDFLQDFLVGRLKAAGMVIGPDFRFGKDRKGDADLLATFGRRENFEVRIVEPVRLDERRVSSSLVRRALQEGDTESATRLLDRVPDVTGRVIRGDGRGRALGFPTANLECEDVLLPKDGVYATVVKRVESPGSKLIHGVANLGTRPTFARGRSVEVHLLDFRDDLYGEELRVGFADRLRDEIKFDGVDSLCAQIERDIHRGRDALQLLDRSLTAFL